MGEINKLKKSLSISFSKIKRDMDDMKGEIADLNSNTHEIITLFKDQLSEKIDKKVGDIERYDKTSTKNIKELKKEIQTEINELRKFNKELVAQINVNVDQSNEAIQHITTELSELRAIRKEVEFLKKNKNYFEKVEEVEDKLKHLQTQIIPKDVLNDRERNIKAKLSFFAEKEDVRELFEKVKTTKETGNAKGEDNSSALKQRIMILENINGRNQRMIELLNEKVAMLMEDRPEKIIITPKKKKEIKNETDYFSNQPREEEFKDLDKTILKGERRDNEKEEKTKAEQKTIGRKIKDFFFEEVEDKEQK